jgi:hypothetical protein
MKNESASITENPVIRPALSPESLPFNLQSSNKSNNDAYNLTRNNILSDKASGISSENKINSLTKKQIDNSDERIIKLPDTRSNKSINENENVDIQSKNGQKIYERQKVDIQSKNGQKIYERQKVDIQSENRRSDTNKQDPLPFDKSLSSKWIADRSDRLGHMRLNSEDAKISPKGAKLEESHAVNQQMARISNGVTKKISINIDHIEIKAVKTDSSSLTQRTVQPTPETGALMSLKQYLANRSRGKY